MDTDDVIDTGDYEEWNNDEYDINEQQEELPDVKPELKLLYQQHPECNLDYIEQIIPKLALKVVPPGGEKADANHRTYPFLTNFEKTKIIGIRANQLSKGGVPYVSIPPHITSVQDIARLELEQKRLPFVIKRPLPNGTYEYWRLADLLMI